jgi:hypothetical protein
VRGPHPFRNGFAVEVARWETDTQERKLMQGPLRTILAGAAAWKFGGGCISTILIFILVFWLLGYVRC